MAKLPQIREMFAGQNVFVTGGSGFMGKVLLEKLLHSCPDIGQIYVLLRPKRGRAAKERLKDIIDTPLFEPLRQERPGDVEKLVAVPGDCLELGLGLSAADADMLADKVSFVFHAAATVRFDDPLKRALLLNTRGTREVLALARRMRNLKMVQHVSTTYCWTNHELTEEKVYTTDLDWRVMIALAEKLDEATLDTVSLKVLDFQPNTYTFSKALAEVMVNEARDELPVMVCRPSVVLGAVSDPIPGWLDNLYGPYGIWAGALKGVLRFSYGEPEVKLAFCPVDWAVRGMILSAWAFASGVRLMEDPSSVEVVNVDGSERGESSYKDQGRILEKAKYYVPNAIRYPRYTITPYYWYYWVSFVVSQLSYALLLDTFLKLAGEKPRLIATYRKIFIANEALAYFMCNQFKFSMKKLSVLENMLHPDEVMIFGLSKDAIRYDNETYERDAVIGIVKYVFKEQVDVKKNEKHLFKLWVLEIVQYIVIACFLFWMCSRLATWYLMPSAPLFQTAAMQTAEKLFNVTY